MKMNLSLLMRVYTVVHQTLSKIFQRSPKTHKSKSLAHYHPFLFGKL